MILSLIVLIFLGFMTYWWGAQGAFSAFLHMMVVIVAGALAFGLWEPAAYFLLGTGSFATPFAWGLSLLALFVLFLVTLRAAMDHLARKNMDFSMVFNHVVGGLFGLIAGSVSAGITIIGFSFLPFGSDIMGYQPYVIVQKAQHDRPAVVAEGGGLWVPVDRFTAGLYTHLSRAPGEGAFVSSRPLGMYLPELLKQAAMFRMRRDLNSAVVAAPASVTLDKVYMVPTPITDMPTLHPEVRAEMLMEKAAPADDQLTSADAAPADGSGGPQGDAAPSVANPDDRVTKMLLEGGNKLLLIDTKWTKEPGTFDADGQLRVPVAQVSLLAFDDRQSYLHHPIAYIDEKHRTRGEQYIPTRDFQAIDSELEMAFSSRQEPLFGWVFVIPESQEPRFLNIRHSRFVIPAVTDAEATMAQRLDRMGVSLGMVPTPDAVAAGNGADDAQAGNAGTGQGTEAISLELGGELPIVISKNRSVHLSFAGPEGNQLLAGEELIEHANVRGQAVRVAEVFSPPNLRVLRLKLLPNQAYSMFGRVRAAAKRLHPVYLVDNLGEQWQPVGYILLYGHNRSQKVRIERDDPIQAGSELPIDDMREGDELYLYFIVRRGITVEAVKVGQDTVLETDVRVLNE